MKKIILISGILIGVWMSSNAQSNTQNVKDIVYTLNGKVTQNNINTLVDSLISNSIDSNRVCLMSLSAWNNCEMSATEVFSLVKTFFFNNLIGKSITVDLVGEKQPWMDEDFHMLHFTLTHSENVEHLTLHINEGYIKNVKYWEENVLTLSD
jgi:hypothetical protein